VAEENFINWSVLDEQSKKDGDRRFYFLNKQRKFCKKKEATWAVDRYQRQIYSMDFYWEKKEPVKQFEGAGPRI